jgi:hypothetical protein
MKHQIFTQFVTITFSSILPVPADAWITSSKPIIRTQSPYPTITSPSTSSIGRSIQCKSPLHETKGDEEKFTDTASSQYKRPQFSDSFRKHMEQIKSNFPENEDEGVDCTGEPSMDPSRMVMDDGLDSEYLSDR